METDCEAKPECFEPKCEDCPLKESCRNYVEPPEPGIGTFKPLGTGYQWYPDYNYSTVDLQSYLDTGEPTITVY